jgi:hypothetical protein
VLAREKQLVSKAIQPRKTLIHRATQSEGISIEIDTLKVGRTAFGAAAIKAGELCWKHAAAHGLTPVGVYVSHIVRKTCVTPFFSAR